MNFLRTAVLILFVLLTFFTIKIHPSLHDPIIIEDADFKLTRISDTYTPQEIPVVTASEQPKNVETIQPQTISIQTQNEPKSTQQVVINYGTQPTQTVTKTVNVQTPQTKTVNVKTNTNETSQKELLDRIIKNTENQKIVQEQKLINEPLQGKIEPRQIPPKVVQKTVEVKPVQQTNKNPYMTEQEEIIAWNIWRSNIHNHIMMNSNVETAAFGTIFKFSFLVDKFGNVSNIKVECSNPYYMDMARNNVKPVIANMQNKPILNFPRGTQRASTVVEGLFAIGTTNRFSSPDDYSDYERVRY